MLSDAINIPFPLSRESYNHVLNWLVDARTLARPDISIVLAGNKCDLKDSRSVSFLEASRCAQENDVLFLETSAVTGEGIEEVFSKACRSIISKIEDGLIDPGTMTLNSKGGVSIHGSNSSVSGNFGNNSSNGGSRCAC
jgi:GTPase SAR1 family protein